MLPREAKIQLVQALKEEDYALRQNFAEEMIRDFFNNDRIDNILFSDEAHFHLNGAVNKQNCRYWAEENPRKKHQTPLHSPRVSVWCAMSSAGIIGPYFFQTARGHTVTINSARYSEMIRHFFTPALQEFDGYNDQTWFQQDGATAHTAQVSMEAVRALFPGKLISKFGDKNWPPRSPDLTPMDFFLWGYLKSKVYATNPATLDALRQRIEEEIAAIPAEMCSRVFQNLRVRLEECLQRNGHHLDNIIFKK